MEEQNNATSTTEVKEEKPTTIIKYEIIESKQVNELILKNEQLIEQNEILFAKVDNHTNYTILIFIILSIYCGFGLGRKLGKK